LYFFYILPALAIQVIPMKPIHALLVIALMAGLSHADVIPADQVEVHHTAYIDNLGDYDGYAFLLYPDAYGGKAVLFSSDMVPGHYKFVAAEIYAIPVSELPENLSGYVPPEGALSAYAPSTTSYAPLGEKNTEVEDHYLIRIEGGKMALDKAEDKGCADDEVCAAQYWLVLPGIVVGLIGGYLIGRGVGR